MRRGIALALLAALVIPFPAAGQAKPDFSGTWLVVGPEQGIRELTITQDASTLSLEGQPDVAKHTFKLDGSDTEMSAPDGKPLLAKAVWEGKTLVITVHFPEIKQDIRRLTWALDADGRLVTETHFLGGKPEPPTRQVFTRR